MLFLLCLISSLSNSLSANCQIIQRQTIGAQGGVFTSRDGQIFSQSIGQMSINGTTKTPVHTFQQGFQQSFVSLFDNKIVPIDFTVSVYPNPFINFFTIAVANPHEESTSISIITMLGQQVYQTQFTPFQTHKTIPFDFYPRGTYIVQFVSRNQTISKKIIKN